MYSNNYEFEKFQNANLVKFYFSVHVNTEEMTTLQMIPS